MNLVQTKREMKKAHTNQQRAEVLANYTGNKTQKELIDTLINTKRNRQVVTNSICRLKALEEKSKLQKEYLTLKSMTTSRLSFKRYIVLKRKAESILSTLDDGYSMGSEKSLYIDGYRIAYRDDTSEYPSSCKYRAKHGNIIVKMSLSELDKLEYINRVWKTNHKSPKTLVESGKYGNYRAEIQSV